MKCYTQLEHCHALVHKFPIGSFYSYQLGCTFLIILVSGKAKSQSAYCVRNMLRNISWKLNSTRSLYKSCGVFQIWLATLA